MQLQDFLSTLAMLLLVIALPIVIAAAVQHFRVMTQRLHQGKDAARWEAIERAVSLGVNIAKQSGVAEGAAQELLRRAIEHAQDFLDAYGVKIDVQRLASLVQAELTTQIQNPTMPADTAQARQALLAAAIQSSVLAAEQSGMKGLIQNVAVEKKNYAMHLARKYLQEHGIRAGDEVLSGLIEAELLRLFLWRKQIEVAQSSVGARHCLAPTIMPIEIDSSISSS